MICISGKSQKGASLAEIVAYSHYCNTTTSRLSPVLHYIRWYLVVVSRTSCWKEMASVFAAVDQCKGYLRSYHTVATNLIYWRSPPELDQYPSSGGDGNHFKLRRQALVVLSLYSRR